MPQIPYRANLSAANYPMTIADGGRTVIVPGIDQNFDRRVDPSGEQKDAGIPQALYLENVMPTPYGYQSVGYMVPTAGMIIPAGATYIKKMIEVKYRRPIDLYRATIDSAPLFIWDNGALTFGMFGEASVVFTGAGFTDAVDSLYSVAIVGSSVYFYHASGLTQDLYTIFRPGTDLQLLNITALVTPLNFFTSESIVSVCASNNYLVACSSTTVYWSSLLSSIDFTSSLVSGAGQINPNNSDAALLYVKETTKGFYVYAATNTMYGQYTGNARYPFKFVPVINSTGPLNFQPWLSYGVVDGLGHYVIEKNKSIRFMQENQSQAVAIEASDYLEKTTLHETLDYITNTFTASAVATQTPSIYVYLNRYVLISVNGTNTQESAAEKYTHVIVFDSFLNRYGKLKLDHSFMFTYYGQPELLGFVNRQASSIKFLGFDIYLTDAFPGTTYTAHEGALLLGKFQYVRSRMMQMEEIEIEGPQNTAITPSPNFSLALLPSTDGRNFDTPIPLTATSISGGLATYHTHQTARNHSLLLKGAFSVNTVQLKFVPGGER